MGKNGIHQGLTTEPQPAAANHLRNDELSHGGGILFRGPPGGHSQAMWTLCRRIRSTMISASSTRDWISTSVIVIVRIVGSVISTSVSSAAITVLYYILRLYEFPLCDLLSYIRVNICTPY